MKSYRKELWLNVPGHRTFITIMPQVEEYLRESGVHEALCLENAMHITASLFINDEPTRDHRWNGRALYGAVVRIPREYEQESALWRGCPLSPGRRSFWTRLTRSFRTVSPPDRIGQYETGRQGKPAAIRWVQWHTQQ